MKKNVSCTLILFCGLFSTAFGQKQISDSISPVNVGGKLPKLLFDLKSKTFVSGQLSESSVAADFNKLIIIDFWASWCGSCLKKFPLLEKMQNKFPLDLKVLLVNSVGTGDSAASLAEKISTGTTSVTVGETGLSFIVEDKMFLSAFPHRALPHYVWVIGGVVEGITSSDFLTEENVLMMVERNKKHVLLVSKSKKFKEGRD